MVIAMADGMHAGNGILYYDGEGDLTMVSKALVTCS
jgi:hypothetical protein